MNNLGNSRASLALAIIGFYLVPIVLLSAYSVGLMPMNSSWSLFSVGLLSGAIGSCGLLLMIYRWENGLRQRLVSAIKSSTPPTEVPQPLPTPPPSHPVPKPAPPPPEIDDEKIRKENEKLIAEAISPWQCKHEQMISELNLKEEELKQSLEERKNMQSQILTLRGELDSFRDKMRLQLQQEQNHNAEFQKTIDEQRAQIESQQNHINAMESKVLDLSYEIKTLVSLTNYENLEKEKSVEKTHAPSLTLYEPKKSPNTDPKISPISSAPLSSQPNKSLEAVSRQLTHFIDIAANMASVQNLHGVPSHLNDFAVDGYGLELRRLCENLNMENRYIVLLHSPKDNKIHFVNDHVKSVLGWTPEEFIRQFSTIILKGKDEWQREIDLMESNREGILSMHLKTSASDAIQLQCHLRAITEGTFRNHVISVLY